MRFFCFPASFVSLFYSYTQLFHVITIYNSCKSMELHEIRTRDTPVTSLVTYHCTTLAYRNKFWNKYCFQITSKQNHAFINYNRLSSPTISWWLLQSRYILMLYHAEVLIENDSTIIKNIDGAFGSQSEVMI